MTKFEYKIIKLSDLPFPHGLGSGKYVDLRDSMKLLLGENQWTCVSVNEVMTQDERYQELIGEHLVSAFGGTSFIKVAETARSLYHTLQLDQGALEATEVSDRFNEGAESDPTYSLLNSDEKRWARDWVHDGPRIGKGVDGRQGVGNGRHRMAWLRHLSFQGTIDENFGVLVHSTVWT